MSEEKTEITPISMLRTSISFALDFAQATGVITKQQNWHVQNALYSMESVQEEAA